MNDRGMQSPLPKYAAPRSVARVRAALSNGLSAAGRTVTRSTQAVGSALGGLYEDVQRDAHGSSYSALSASQLNILDVYAVSRESEFDVAHNLRHVEATEAALASDSEGVLRNSPLLRVLSRFRTRFVTFTTAPSSWVYLLCLGALAALLAFCVDAPVSSLLAARSDAVSAHPAAAYIIWLLWGVGLSLAAAAIGHSTPMSEGSGIPQMKSVLAGTDLAGFFSLRVGLAKLAGLILAQGAGLSIGKEGPFVHIAGCFAALLWRIPYFNSIAANDSLRRQMLAAAVAAGVTAVFGTPVGAVLFAIETTSTYFLTSSYWRCFLCAIVCRFAFDVMAIVKSDTTFEPTAFPATNLNLEVLAFTALGIICGVLGSIFVYSVNKARIARRLVMTSTWRRYALVAVSAALVASLTYSTSYMRKGDKAAVNDLFSDDGMSEWTSPNLLFSLALFFALKFIVTVVSISMPLACGLFIPLFVMGAAAGRAFGEALRASWPSILPGAYAVVGAAALTSGATQTVSTAVIVFEMTGQTSHMLPVLLGTLVAYSVSSLFTISIYDLLLKHAGLPYLPRVYASDVYNLTARDVMHHDARFLTTGATHREALELLQSPPYSRESEGTVYAQRVGLFPIVESAARPVLCGAVSRAGLESFFRRARERERVTAATPVTVTPVASPTRSAGYDAPKLVAVNVVPTASPLRSDSPCSDDDLMPVSLTASHVQAATGAITPARQASAAASARVQVEAMRAEYAALRSPDRAVVQVTSQSSSRGGNLISRALRTVSSLFGRSAALGETPDDATAERGATMQYLSSLLSSADDITNHSFNEAWLDSPMVIHGLTRRTPREGGEQVGIRMDPAPFQVADMTPLTKIHYLFAICLFSDLIVTRDGMLAGVIVKDDLINPRRLSGERLTNTSTGDADVEVEGQAGAVTGGSAGGQ